MQRSCSSFRVSVKRVSPARAEAMMPALHTSESVSVDLPWSTWAMTDMLRMLAFLSMMARIWSTVKFTWAGEGELRPAPGQGDRGLGLPRWGLPRREQERGRWASAHPDCWLTPP